MNVRRQILFRRTMGVLCLLAAALNARGQTQAQAPPAAVTAAPGAIGSAIGSIEGADVAVKGQVRLIREAGRSRMELSNGSEITVRSGTARITLRDGSEVDVCGPAQLTLIENSGSLTVALSSGRVHGRLAPNSPVTIYTAMVQASLLSVGGEPRETAAGVAPDGSVCILSARGAVRLEQQLTGESVIVPQFGDVLLPGGSVRDLREAPARGGCACLAKDPAPETPPPQAATVSASARREERDAPPATEVPIWKVLMPPLTFDAANPPHAAAADPATARGEARAETAILVREVRVQHAVVFRGRVEKKSKAERAAERALVKEQQRLAKAKRETMAVKLGTVSAAETSAAAKSGAASTGTPSSGSAPLPAGTPASSASAAATSADAPQAKETFASRVGGFFRRLFGGKPKPKTP